MCPFTKVSIDYFKVLSPSVNLEEIEISLNSPLNHQRTWFTSQGLGSASHRVLTGSSWGRSADAQPDVVLQQLLRRTRRASKALSIQMQQRAYRCVRPLLSLHRFDIQNLCFFWKLPLYPDRSNKQFLQSRNRIRKQILPIIRFYLNPQAEAVLFQFTEILNQEDSHLERLAHLLVHEGLLLVRANCDRTASCHAAASLHAKTYDLQRAGFVEDAVFIPKDPQIFDLGVLRMQRSTCIFNCIEDRSVHCYASASQLHASVFHAADMQSTASRLHTDRSVFHTYAMHICKQSNRPPHDSLLLKELSAFPLSAMPLVFQRRIVKLLLEKILGKNATFFQIERIIPLLKRFASDAPSADAQSQD